MVQWRDLGAAWLQQAAACPGCCGMGVCDSGWQAVAALCCVGFQHWHRLRCHLRVRSAPGGGGESACQRYMCARL
jgi:hypothetical protein